MALPPSQPPTQPLTEASVQRFIAFLTRFTAPDEPFRQALLAEDNGYDGEEDLPSVAVVRRWYAQAGYSNAAQFRAEVQAHVAVWAFAEAAGPDWQTARLAQARRLLPLLPPDEADAWRAHLAALEAQADFIPDGDDLNALQPHLAALTALLLKAQAQQSRTYLMGGRWLY